MATAFKGLTIVTFTEGNLEDTPSTSNQQTYRPFHYSSPSPSPTTTEEIEVIPELVENQDLPLPDEVLDDNISIEDLDWSPPSVAFLPWLGKRKQNSSSPDTGECWRCKQLNTNSGLAVTSRENNEMTDKLFKFQNIQLIPTNTRATSQNTILPTEGTAEEQFAAIEASTCQHILNDI